MSNSAVIKIDKTPLCIYTKWYGTFADVVAYACYAKMRNFGSPDIDPSGITSLIQVMANCSSDGFGVEVMPYEDSKEIQTDNGTFVLEGWEVVDIEGHRGSEHAMNDDLVERVVRIDMCQPEAMQIGAGFIRDIASRKATFAGELAVGDVIWDRGDGASPVRATIVGFGDSGYPYVHVDSDPAFANGKPRVTDRYARDHFGKFLGNTAWFARIPELSHPQATAASFRGRPVENNLPGQVSLHVWDTESKPVATLSEAPEASEEENLMLNMDSFPFDDEIDVDDPDDIVADNVLSTVDVPYDDAGFGTEDLDEPDNLIDDDMDDPDGIGDLVDKADDDMDDFGGDEMTNTGLLQMVLDNADEEDEFSITNDLVIPTESTYSSEGLSVSELLDSANQTSDNSEEHIVMTNAESDTERVKIIQPLPQDDASIDAVTIQMSDSGDTVGRSVFIPLKPSEIEPDLSTDATAKNPSPYPDVLDASFAPYEEA